MLCRAKQDGLVMMERSEKTWFTGEGIQHSFLEDHMNGMKKQKDMMLKDKLTVQ